jgi:hypothetical protein
VAEKAWAKISHIFRHILSNAWLRPGFATLGGQGILTEAGLDRWESKGLLPGSPALGYYLTAGKRYGDL